MDERREITTRSEQLEAFVSVVDAAGVDRFRLANLLHPVILLLTFSLSASLSAADTIYLRQPGTDTVMSIPATIDDFTGKFITYRTATAVKQEPTSSVERIEHRFSEAFEQTRRLFEAGNFEAAEEGWTRELAAEPKGWVRREIRSWLIRAAWRRERWGDAGRQFLAIAEEDPETFHWPIAPLVWTPLTLREADRVVARGWLEDPAPVARLLGASLLLKDRTLGDSAKSALNALIRDPSRQVSDLAKAQLWRTRVGQPISDSELASWRGHAAHLPAALRGGPQYLVATAYRDRSQFDRAAAEFLWLPLVDSQHEPTVARASLEAGEMLLRAGRRDDALRILSDAAADFPWSASARDAKSLLSRLQTE